MSTTPKKKVNVLFMAQFAMLLALEAIVCFTPLGSLPIGPMVATLAMLPVIVTAILLGTGAGAAMGFITGLFSFIVWTFMPPNPLTAFVFTPAYPPGNFWSLVICFVPRTLAGVVTGVTYRGLRRLLAGKKLGALPFGVSGVLGSLTNTLPVMFGIYLFFGRSYADALDISFNLLLGIIGTTILTNGILEAVLGGLVAIGVCMPLEKKLRHTPRFS